VSTGCADPEDSMRLKMGLGRGDSRTLECTVEEADDDDVQQDGDDESAFQGHWGYWSPQAWKILTYFRCLEVCDVDRW
jgi:hypothetical protein